MPERWRVDFRLIFKNLSVEVACMGECTVKGTRFSQLATSHPNLFPFKHKDVLSGVVQLSRGHPFCLHAKLLCPRSLLRLFRIFYPPPRARPKFGHLHGDAHHGPHTPPNTGPAAVCDPSQPKSTSNNRMLPEVGVKPPKINIAFSARSRTREKKLRR